MSPRIVWFGCLCSSSFIYCVLQLDPYCVLSLFSCPVRQFITWLDVALLLDSLGVTMYLYVDVIYRQHLTQVPPALTRVWIFSNGLATLLVSVIALSGAATNNIFWFGVCGIVIVIQELVLLIGFLGSAQRVVTIINSLKTHEGGLNGQVRKLLIIRVAAAVLLPVAMLNQLFGGESLIMRLGQWGHPVPLDYLAFDLGLVLPNGLTILAHAFFLYSVRPSAPSSTSSASAAPSSNSRSTPSRPNSTTTRGGGSSIA